jgi:uncharacterized UPF0160 family protein
LNTDSIFIVTHDGPFHADEVLAIAWIIHVNPLARVTILRTRDEATISRYRNEGMALIIDVGGKCCPRLGWLDHHLAEGRPTWDDGSPMASAGLSLHYMLKKHGIAFDSIPEEVVQLFKNVDSVDNGGTAPTDFQFSRLVAECNPSGINTSAEDFYKSFKTVVKIVQMMLSGLFRGDLVGIEDAQRFFEAYAAPMLKRHAAEMEASSTRMQNYLSTWKTSKTLLLNNFEPAAKLMVVNMPGLKLYGFPMINGSAYIVQVVPKTGFLFPKEWRGLNSEAALTKVGAPGGVEYCHHGGFLCKVKDKAAAEALLEHFNK